MGDRTSPSIFSDANMLAQIRSSVFPDLNGKSLEVEVEDSPENFTTYLQACNLLTLVTRNEEVATSLQISGSSFISEVYSTFFTPLDTFVSKFVNDDQEKDVGMSMAGLGMLLDGLREPLKFHLDSKSQA